MEPTLKYIPLGGVAEIGKNMSAIEYGDQIMVIDCGLMFPDEDMLGVDIVIPDVTYLVENADKVQGIVFTHGHEDHIGALPYVLRQINLPIWGTRLTMGMVRAKLEEHGLVETTEMNIVEPGDRIRLGQFDIEFIRVSHSIPDGVALAIRTPVGVIVHSGDFKFDHNPVDGRRTDFAKLAEAYGIPGVSVKSNAEVSAVIAEAMATDGPFLIDFQIEREHNVFPMVPSGQPIHEMIRRPLPTE